MTSPPEVADLNGNIFGRTSCSLSFAVIALIFSELRGGGGIRPPSVKQDQKKPGLNRVNFPQLFQYVIFYFPSCGDFHRTCGPIILWLWGILSYKKKKLALVTR